MYKPTIERKKTRKDKERNTERRNWGAIYNSIADPKINKNSIRGSIIEMVKQETEVHFELCTRYYLISLEAKHSYFPQYPVVLPSSAISIYHLQCKKHAVPSELKERFHLPRP